MKKVLMIICIACSVAAHAQTKKPLTIKKPVTSIKPETVFKNSVDSFSYAMGLQGAAFYKSQGVTTMNTSLLKKGFDDTYANKTPLLTQEQCNTIIQKTMQSNSAIKDQKSKEETKIVKEEGRKFLAANKTKPGVTELPGGLQYEVIKQGTGPIPKATDTIKAHYIGRLTDGKEFDNSYSRGEPIKIPVTGVIPGWVQALQMMPVGSKWKLYIPSDLGYGDRGAGPIPGGAVLIFEIELLEIVGK